MAKITLKPLDDGQKPVDIPFGKTTIGRGPFLGCGDKKVSRNHAVLEVTEKGEVFLTPTHVNPCFYQPTAESPGTILKKDKRHKLENGDSFSLLPRAFRYKLVVIGDTIESKTETKCDTKLENNSSNGSADGLKQKEENSVFVNEEISRLKADEHASEESSNEALSVKETKPDSIKPKKEQEINGTGSPTSSKENDTILSGERNSRTLPGWLENLSDHPNKPEKKKPQAVKLQNREKPSKHKAENSVKRKIPKTYEKSESEDDFDVREADRPKRATGRCSRQNRQTRQGLSLEDFVVSDDEDWQSDKEEPKVRKRRGRRRGDESGSDWEAEHGKKRRIHRYDSESESGSDWGASNRRKKSSKIKRRKSKRVAASEAGSDEDMEDDTSSARNSKNSKRIPCTYGKKCYRKNPNHLSQFSHPGDSDYFSETEESQDKNEGGSSGSGVEEVEEVEAVEAVEEVEVEEKKKECPYGTSCFRKNPQHRKDFNHTKKVRPQREAAKQAVKKTKTDGTENDEPDSYDLNDSFLNDDSEVDEYKPVESGSDWDSGEEKGGQKGIGKETRGVKNKKAVKPV